MNQGGTERPPPTPATKKFSPGTHWGGTHQQEAGRRDRLRKVGPPWTSGLHRSGHVPPLLRSAREPESSLRFSPVIDRFLPSLEQRAEMAEQQGGQARLALESDRDRSYQGTSPRELGSELGSLAGQNRAAAPSKHVHPWTCREGRRTAVGVVGARITGWARVGHRGCHAFGGRNGSPPPGWKSRLPHHSHGARGIDVSPAEPSPGRVLSWR